MAEQNSIQSFSEAHEIGKEFYRIQKDIDSLGVDAGYGMKTITIPWDTIGDQVDYFSQTYGGLDTPQYYIRFQSFLFFLQYYIIPNIDFDSSIKMIKIDKELNSNIIYTVPGSLSSNPNICMTKRGTYTVDSVNYTTIPAAETFSIAYEGTTSGATYGKIMNIYFNMFWILQQIDSLKDSQTGKISLYGLLDALCQGYNQATGNFNRLEPIVDTEENIIRIVDDVALPDRDLILKSLGSVPSNQTALFDTYGYVNGTGKEGDFYGKGVTHASFIRDLNFNTAVTPNLATMITVGATNQGYVKGEDATALSRMNRGLTDRFKKQITNYDETPETTTALPSLETQYAGAITAYNNYVKNIGCYTTENMPTYDKDAVSDFQSLQTQIIEYYQASSTIKAAEVDKTAASPNAGFLPFDLSLTMDGLSGMKVYQTFNIDSDFLPANYPGTLLFLIRGITNKIENNQWTTTIDSMCVAKNPFAASGSSNPVDEASRKTNRGYERALTSDYPVVNTSAYSNITFKDSSLGNPTSDRINPNLLSDINQAAQSVGLKVVVTTAVSGHNILSKSGKVSRHGAGNAVDIAIIDNVGSGGATNSTNGNAQFREKGNKLKDALVALGYSWNVESGKNTAVLWQTSTGGNHYNHLHVSRRT